ncbi:MAG: hypothetical protein GY736_08935 [Sphingomonas sp.]|uniref:Transcriptional regulator with XRE-family HTH domain n=1 Tax=Sphingomonas aquatilis TaxID=93063 RepID=A0AAW3TYU3_9SPHN|nr:MULTISPECIES: hypothetical protein [Sphingomonas]MBB3877019.1 transcriptional regulator with XRE-family HTH domain [Sphingomonas aquatilis]MCP4026416.1 hypothetical protein [Sphingomonas sp.]GEM71955.1 hypothetical protein SAQ01S_17210 [Sphingomonas aquatilis NBRC 16722]
MSDLLDQVETRRLALAISQKTVAERLGITQPHYSKVVGRLVVLTPRMEEAMRGWLDDVPTPPATLGPRASRIRSLTRSIQRQLRELNALVEQDGAQSRRPPTRTTRRN